MNDPKQTVENIRGFIAAADQTVTPELSIWAAEYAEHCREANGRLRRCADFLRQGLRAEAIQYADCMPPLLDQVSILDFPEVAAWEQACASYGLARPIRLMLDAAKSLNDAYSEQQSLEPLLVQQRVMALTNSPLCQRLSLLRKLARGDPLTAFWMDDISSFEAARLSTLRSEVPAAIKSASLPWIDQLLAEVTAEPWRTPVPQPLKESLSQASTTLRQASVRQRLHELAPRMREAFAAMNIEECRQVHGQWNQIVQEAAVPEPPDLTEEVAPLRNWLQQLEQRSQSEQQFRAGCDELAAALDRDAPDAELAEQYRKLRTFEMEVPPRLRDEFDRRIRSHQRGRQREKLGQILLAILLAGAVAAALVALAVVFIFNHRH